MKAGAPLLQVAIAQNAAQEYKRIVKTLLQVFVLLALIVTLACLAAGVGFFLAGTASPNFNFPGMQWHGAPHLLGAAFGLFIAAVAVVFALAVAAVAVAGAFLAVLFALLLTGLILLAVALPFLLPFIIPIVLVFVVVLATRRSRSVRAA